jgi:hypothetical protein
MRAAFAALSVYHKTAGFAVGMASFFAGMREITNGFFPMDSFSGAKMI